MNRRFMAGAIAIAAAVTLQAALADKNDPTVWTPPRIVQRPDEFNECHVDAAGALPKDADRSVELLIATDGTLKEFSLPKGSPSWMTILSDCVVKQLRFSPWIRDDKPMESGAFLMIAFRARGPGQAAGFAVENVGPVITAPRISNRARITRNCVPDTVTPGTLSRFVVTLTVQPDGSMTDLVFPVGSQNWQQELARCLLGRITFFPGTRDGFPVAAAATMPISLRDDSGGITPSELRSTAQELESAYRACYPPDLLTMTSAFYSFNIATNGKVSSPKLLKGTGDPRLDDAGVCILKMLEFTPMMQNGRAIKSTATWELPLRPHR